MTFCHGFSFGARGIMRMFRRHLRSLTCFSSRVASTMEACLTQLPELASPPRAIAGTAQLSWLTTRDRRTAAVGCRQEPAWIVDARSDQPLSFFLCRLFPRFAASSVCLQREGGGGKKKTKKQRHGPFPDGRASKASAGGNEARAFLRRTSV